MSNRIPQFNGSLKFKIIFSMLAVMGVVSAVSLFEMRRASALQMQKSLLMMQGNATKIGQAIAAQFYERYGDVQAFALNPALQSGNHASISSFLDQYVALYGIYDIILYVDANGRYIAANDKAADGRSLNVSRLAETNFGDAPWFKAVMNGAFTEDAKRGYVGTYFEDAHFDPLFSTVYGEKAIGTSFSAAVKDSKGKVIGVITNRANFSWVENELKVAYEILNDHHALALDLTLLNKQGEILVDIDREAIVDGKLKRKEQSILRTNLVQMGFSPAKEAQSGKTGSMFTPPLLGDKQQAVSFHSIDTPKWIPTIGWSVLLYEPSEELLATEIEMQNRFFLSIGFCVLLVSLISWWFTRSLSNKFIAVSDRLKDAVELTKQTSRRLMESSQIVAESSAEQSAAVQETVSSMSEISSMIAQTNTHLRECTDIATQVGTQSEQGNQTMRRLAAAMDSVNHANSQLQNMANIINEVSSKTMIINDIVFKTQLLSINASIEAARAGQHGKGFAVVAEEVGNLAQMSGNAAKEIQLLITDSQKQVGQIIEVTQSRSRESQGVSNEAVASFSEIATGVKAINERLQGVAQATKEQELGIQQINIAMGQMDQTTQRNSGVSTDANRFAKDLSVQAERSYRVMRALRTLVVGKENVNKHKNDDVIDRIIGDQDVSSPKQTYRDESSNAASDMGSSETSSLQEVAARLAQRFEPSAGLSAPGEKSEASADDPSFRKSA